MKSQRPVDLDLTKYRFPRMAIVSILHRVSGVFIFLVLPFMLYLLHQSLLSQNNFDALHVFLGSPVVKIILWMSLSAVFLHLLAGIRHLLMDAGFFEGLHSGKMTATLVLILFVVVTILTGVWLW